MGTRVPDGGPMNLRKAFAIAGVNLRRLTRDKTGAFFVFVFPFLIILALGAAFGSGFTPQLGVVSTGSGPLGQDLRDRLAATDGLEVQAFSDVEAMRTAIERGQLEGGLEIPSGYDVRILAGETVPLEYVARPTGTQELRSTVTAVVDEQSVVIRAARFAVSEGTAGSFDEALTRARAVAATMPRIEVATRTAGGESAIGSFASGAAAELVLFVFLTSLSASAMLIETRRLGVTRRMLASPTEVRTIVVGETLGRFAIALVQGLLIVAGTVVLFRVDWGDPLTTGLVVLLFALAATGAAMVMGSVLKNASQAGAMGVFLGLVLAAIGGCMVPLEIFPPLIYRIAHLFPHAWAIEALNASIATGAGPAQVSTELWVLAAYAVGLLAIASVLLRRSSTGRAT
jgi:ABC-2 type transport system permease protein